jgi:hypothetical protein
MNANSVEVAMKKLSGPLALFRPKIRVPASLTFTKKHHEKIAAGMARLNLSRSDFIGLLVEKYAEHVELPDTLPTLDDDDTLSA